MPKKKLKLDDLSVQSFKTTNERVLVGGNIETGTDDTKARTERTSPCTPFTDKYHCPKPFSEQVECTAQGC